LRFSFLRRAKRSSIRWGELILEKIVPEMGASSRGKIGFAGGELLDRAVGKTEVEVSGIVEGFGNASDFGCPSSESESLAELEAAVSPIFHCFGDRLQEAVG